MVPIHIKNTRLVLVVHHVRDWFNNFLLRTGTKRVIYMDQIGTFYVNMDHFNNFLGIGTKSRIRDRD